MSEKHNIKEFTNKIELHDSTLTKIDYRKELELLILYFDLANEMKAPYRAGDPSLRAGALAFFGVTSFTNSLKEPVICPEDLLDGDFIEKNGEEFLEIYGTFSRGFQMEGYREMHIKAADFQWIDIYEIFSGGEYPRSKKYLLKDFDQTIKLQDSILTDITYDEGLNILILQLDLVNWNQSGAKETDPKINIGALVIHHVAFFTDSLNEQTTYEKILDTTISKNSTGAKLQILTSFQKENGAEEVREIVVVGKEFDWTTIYPFG